MFAKIIAFFKSLFTKPAALPAPIEGVVKAPAPPTSEPVQFEFHPERGEYRKVTTDDLKDYGAAYFKAHPGYGKDCSLPSKILEFWRVWFNTHEIAGPAASPIQVWFLHFCDLDEKDANSDETPGCAAGLNAAMITAGFKGSAGGVKGKTSAGATSFAKMAKKISEPVLYCIVVMRHLTGGLKGHYHVSTVVQIENGKPTKCRGNNQGNQICTASYDFTHEQEAVAYIWDFEPLVGGK